MSSEKALFAAGLLGMPSDFLMLQQNAIRLLREGEFDVL